MRVLNPLEGIGVQNLDPVVHRVVQRLAVDNAVLRERIGGAERDLRSQELALRELRLATDHNACLRPVIDDIKDQLQADMRAWAEQCKMECKALVKVLREEMMSQSIEWRRTNAAINSIRTEMGHAPREDLKSMESRLLNEMHQQAATIRSDVYQPKKEQNVGTVGSPVAKKEHDHTFVTPLSSELDYVRAEEKRIEDEVREMANRLNEIDAIEISSSYVLEADKSPSAVGHAGSSQSPPLWEDYFTDANTRGSPSPLGASSLNSTAASALPPLKSATSSYTDKPPYSSSPTSPSSKIDYASRRPSEDRTHQSDAGAGPRGTQGLRRELMAMRFA
jgi:hypothetical protein